MTGYEAQRRRPTSTLRSPSRNPSELRRERWVTAFGCVVALALYLGFDGPTHGEGRPTWFVVTSIASWIAVASAAMWGAAGGGRTLAARSRTWFLTIAFGTPAVLLGLSLVVSFMHPELTVLHAERTGFRCFGLTLAAAACPLVGLALVRRSRDAVHGRAAGAALGAASGASAGVMVQFWCPVAAPLHALIGHTAPIVVLALLGASIGGRVIGGRS